jgi:hypothetical protein
MATSASSSSTCGKRSTHGSHVEAADSVERPCWCDACRRAGLGIQRTLDGRVIKYHGVHVLQQWLLRRRSLATPSATTRGWHIKNFPDDNPPIHTCVLFATWRTPSNKSSVQSFDLARAARSCVQHRAPPRRNLATPYYPDLYIPHALWSLLRHATSSRIRVRQIAPIQRPATRQRRMESCK